MNSWIRFFLGSPKRAAITIFLLFVGLTQIAPTFAQQVLGKVVLAAQPLFGPIITLVIIGVVLKIMLSSLFGKKK